MKYLIKLDDPWKPKSSFVSPGVYVNMVDIKPPLISPPVPYVYSLNNAKECFYYGALFVKGYRGGFEEKLLTSIQKAAEFFNEK